MVMVLKDRKTQMMNLGYLLVISMIVMRKLTVNKGILTVAVEILL